MRRHALVAAAVAALALPAVPAPAATGAPAATCSSHDGRFTPTHLDIAGLGGRTVVPVPRAANGQMGSPPVTAAGKSMVGWDTGGARPGSARGTVALDAHTWPDGTALGNQMLRGTGPGDVLVLSGGGERLCYRVTKRREYVPSRAPLNRIFSRTDPHKLVFIVCSGTRLGPGNWTTRTVWYATPIP